VETKINENFYQEKKVFWTDKNSISHINF